MSKLLSLLAILAATVHANDTTCGDDPDKMPNCNMPDHGSCGNACCILDMVLRDSPQAVYNQTVAFLKAGGYDGSFAYVTGPDAAGHNPDDYLGAGVGPTSSWWYIFQGSHSTTGGYIDTLNFFLKANAAGHLDPARRLDFHHPRRARRPRAKLQDALRAAESTRRHRHHLPRLRRMSP